MLQSLSKLGAVLMVVVSTAWVGAWVPPAAAAAKKATAPAPVPQTGADQSFAPGDDAALQAGVPFPTPRFTDQRNGTVKDNLTGLLWLKNAACLGPLLWKPAIAAANQLASGQCDLADGSVAGDWRLPNVRELLSLLDYGFFNPTVSNTAGTGPATDGDPCDFNHKVANFEAYPGSALHVFPCSQLPRLEPVPPITWQRVRQ